MDTTQFLAFIVHSTAFSLYTYAIFYDYTVIADNMPLYTTFGGRWKFLTWWNVCFQTSFFALSLLNDIFGTNIGPNRKSKLGFIQKIKDQYFTSVVWPMGIFVVLTFWALFFVDRDLVYPEHLDKIIPSWHNHTYHTYVLPFLLLEIMLVYHKVPNRKSGLSVVYLVSLVYISWVFFVAFYADFWVYPVLEVLSWPGRIGFIGGLLVLVTMIYVIGENLTFVAWGETSEVLKKKQ